VKNTSDTALDAFLDVNLSTLGVKVTEGELGARYTQIFDLEGRDTSNVLWEEIADKPHYWNRGAACFDGWIGKIVLLLKPGETRYLCLDKN